MTPRLKGVIEQFERAKSFLEEAQGSTDRIFRFRHLVAAIYFATSMAELLLASATNKDITQSKSKTYKTLHKMLPRYGLLSKLRANDFHRWGVIEEIACLLKAA